MQFAVIGNPIHHSLSPILHNSAFKALGIRGFYGRYLLENSASFSSLKSLHLIGANITVPFKEVAFESCDEVFGIANKIGAINTIVFKNGKMLGHNTDALGFYQCIESLHLKTALIIGAGGSAKAVAHILRENGISTMLINRSQGRLEDFNKEGFNTATFESFTTDILYYLNSTNAINTATPAIESIDFKNTIPTDSTATKNHQINKATIHTIPQTSHKIASNSANLTPKTTSKAKYELVINTTPAGLTSDSLPLDSKILTPILRDCKFAFDLVYGRQTPFLKLAKSLNIPHSDGKEMLINQAILAFEIFMESQNIPINQTILRESMQSAI